MTCSCSVVAWFPHHMHECIPRWTWQQTPSAWRMHSFINWENPATHWAGASHIFYCHFSSPDNKIKIPEYFVMQQSHWKNVWLISRQNMFFFSLNIFGDLDSRLCNWSIPIYGFGLHIICFGPDLPQQMTHKNWGSTVVGALHPFEELRLCDLLIWKNEQIIGVIYLFIFL